MVSELGIGKLVLEQLKDPHFVLVVRLGAMPEHKVSKCAKSTAD